MGEAAGEGAARVVAALVGKGDIAGEIDGVDEEGDDGVGEEGKAVDACGEEVGLVNVKDGLEEVEEVLDDDCAAVEVGVDVAVGRQAAKAIISAISIAAINKLLKRNRCSFILNSLSF